jgi:cyclase
MNQRIIARLDIKGANLVKGIQLEGLRVLGKPELFAKYYYENGADELLFMDVVASLYGRNSLIDLISKTARDVFIPLTVGGGIRSLDDINSVLRAGADKVCLNTSAIKNPNLVKEAAKKYGSSTIVIAIEAIKQVNGDYLAYTDNGREFTGVEVIKWAKKVEELGAGEVILTSVDHEGTGIGFDIDLISNVASQLTIPVVAHGGCGKMDDLLELFNKTEAQAVSLASIIHYDTFNRLDKLEIGDEGNLDFLHSGRGFKNIHAESISNIKKYLSENKISCRSI